MGRTETCAGILATGLLALLHAGCMKTTPSGPYVARVDDAVLTTKDLAALQDSSASPGNRMAYVNSWVTNEVLYQEALRRGLADDPTVRRQVEDARKTLLVNALLERELYSDEQVDEDAILAYFRTSPAIFTLREDVAQISYVVFTDRDAANGFRSTVLRGTSWGDAVEHVRTDSVLAPQLRRVASHQYVTRATLFPDELWKLARTLPPNDISFVVTTDVGYYVMVVHSFMKQGETPALEYVHDEIRDRMLIEQRRLRYERLLAGLRSTHTVDIREDIQDSSAQE